MQGFDEFTSVGSPFPQFRRNLVHSKVQLLKRTSHGIHCCQVLHRDFELGRLDLNQLLLGFQVYLDNLNFLVESELVFLQPLFILYFVLNWLLQKQTINSCWVCKILKVEVILILIQVCRVKIDGFSLQSIDLGFGSCLSRFGQRWLIILIVEHHSAVEA